MMENVIKTLSAKWMLVCDKCLGEQEYFPSPGDIEGLIRGQLVVVCAYPNCKNWGGGRHEFPVSMLSMIKEKLISE